MSFDDGEIFSRVGVCIFSTSLLLYDHLMIEEYSPMHSQQHIRLEESSLMFLLTHVCFNSESLFDVYYHVMMKEYSSMHIDGGLFIFKVLTYICYVLIA